MTTEERLKRLEGQSKRLEDDSRRVNEILRIILQSENYLGDVLEILIDQTEAKDDNDK